jgi:DNA-binding transcriptional ArsR family regulator
MSMETIESASRGQLELPAVLQALSDPIRLQIVRQLAVADECACNGFGLSITKSTCSHHLRVLREAGLIEQRVDGKQRLNRLRVEALEERFPGLLGAVLGARPEA